MTFLLIFSLIILLMIGCWIAYCQSLVTKYLQQAHQNVFEGIGVSAKSFIGLHIQNTTFVNHQAKLIYVRKTTPYQGLILFVPDRCLDYHFYLPWLVSLCRQGYLILCHQGQETTLRKMPEALKMLLEEVSQDEILKTYPLTLLGHGAGAYAILQALPYTDSQTKAIALALPQNEDDAFLTYVKTKLPLPSCLEKVVLSVFEKKYPPLAKWQKPLEQECLVISGREQLNYLSLNEADFNHIDIQLLENKSHYPFLNSESDKCLCDMVQYLNSPEISQFNYNKTLEQFDINMLTDIDLDVLQMILQFIEK